MKTLNHILVPALLLVTYSSIAQNKLSGKVIGIDGPIEGVKITCIETGTKVATNQSGEFLMESKLEDIQLLATFKKMTKTVKLANCTTPLVIQLIPDEKKLYKTLLERNELRLCDIYMDNYPEGIYIKEVSKQKEKLYFIEAYNLAASQFSDTALRNYLKQYPEGTYKEKANDAIEIAAWQKAKYENTAQSYQDYLQQYPNGKASNLAKEKLATLK